MAALPGWTSLPTPLVGPLMDSGKTKNKPKTVNVGEEEKRKESKGTGTFKVPVVRCDELVRAQLKNIPPAERCGSSAEGTPAWTESEYSSGADWGDLSHLLVSRYRDRSERRAEPAATPAAAQKRRSTARRRAREEEDNSDSGSDVSVMSAEDRLSRGESSKRRGRPPSTGEYVGLAAAKERLNEARRQELELQKEQEVFDSTVETPAPSRSSRPLAEVSELMKEAKQLPVPDLVAEMIKNTELIRRVAAKSSNLKGTFVRSLRESSNIIEAYAAELAKRPQNSGPEVDEVQELRRRLAEAEADRARLRRDVDELRRLIEQRRDNDDSDLPDLSLPGTPPPRRMEDEPAVRKRRASVRNSSDEGDVPKRRATGGQEHRPPHEVVPVPPPRRATPVPPQTEEVAELALAVANLTAMVRELAENVRAKEVPPSAASRKVKSRDSSRKEKRQNPNKRQDVAPKPQDEAKEPPTWAKVVGRKAHKQAGKTQVAAPKKQPPQVSRTKAAPKAGKKKKKPALPKPPAMAAFTITIPAGVKTSYTEVMVKAREAVPPAQLQQIGIGEFKVRKTATGGLLLAVPGEEGSRKVKELVGRLRAAFQGTEVRIAQPAKMADLRVLGIEDSVTAEEAREELARVGQCAAEDVRVGEIKRSARSMGTLWVRCPLAAANKIAEARRIRLGWASARIEVLASRPFFCYRCLQQGHTANVCSEGVDRSRKCYNCGQEGHRAAQCTAAASCPLCKDKGRPAAHRLGASGCAPRPKRGRSQKAAAAQTPPEAPQRAVVEDDTMTE